MKAKLVVFGVLIALLLAVTSVTLADDTINVDFEGFTEGAIVSHLNLGMGYSGSANVGTIGVFGVSQVDTTRNAAMIFDSNCVGGCSGGDPDLQSNTGNVLIVTEDWDSSDPDDRMFRSYLQFDLAGLFAGAANIQTLQLTDTEEGGWIDFYSGATLIKTVTIPMVADGTVYTLNIDANDVTYFQIRFNGSGSVDNIRMVIPGEPQGGEGCTPGFWKQRAVRINAWAATGYTTGDSYATVFGVGPGVTLLEALNTGGGGTDALLRHSTAALLNAAHPDISYLYSPAQVIAMTQAAWNGGDVEGTKNLFDEQNNAGCFD